MPFYFIKLLFRQIILNNFRMYLTVRLSVFSCSLTAPFARTLFLCSDWLSQAPSRCHSPRRRMWSRRGRRLSGACLCSPAPGTAPAGRRVLSGGQWRAARGTSQRGDRCVHPERHPLQSRRTAYGDVRTPYGLKHTPTTQTVKWWHKLWLTKHGETVCWSRRAYWYWAML